MKHPYALLLVLLLAWPARLRAQTILMPTGTGSAVSTGCAGTLYDAGGANGNYANNQSSTLTLRPSVVGNRVSLSFTGFSLENTYDFLYIYDGLDAGAPLLAMLTGSQGLSQTYAATNVMGALTVRFASDVTGVGSGFAATLSCAPPPASAFVGNVGVGTAQPLEKLQVAGTIYSSQGGVRFPDGSLQTTASAPDNLGNHTATRNLGLNGHWLSGDGGSEGLRIDNSGRVGIGTATPDRPLTIQGSGTDDQLISLRNSAGTARWHWNMSAGGLNLAETGEADYRLFVQQGGRVGIGTGSPQQALDVAGTVQAQNFAYPAAQERVLQVSPFSFVSTSSAAPVSISGSGTSLAGISLSGSGAGLAVAPLSLPVGAVVTRIELWALDNDENNTATQVRLVEFMPIAGINLIRTSTAYASLTGNSSNIRTASATVSMPISPDASYYVEYNANRNGNCVLMGVRLTYTVTQAD